MAGTRGSTGGKRKPKARPDNDTARYDSLLPEILRIALIAAGLFLALAVYSDGGAGIVGGWLGRLAKGLFGLGAYILPPVTAALGVFGLFAKRRVRGTGRLFAALFIVIITLAYIFNRQAAPTEEGRAFVAALYTTGRADNGGLVGGLLGAGLLRVIGVAGSYIALFTLGVIALILLTGRSLFALIAKIVNAAKNGAKELTGGIATAMSGEEDEFPKHAEHSSEHHAEPHSYERERHGRGRYATITLTDESGEKRPEPAADTSEPVDARLSLSMESLSDDDGYEEDGYYGYGSKSDAPPWVVGEDAKDEDGGSFDGGGISIKGLGIEGATPVLAPLSLMDEPTEKPPKKNEKAAPVEDIDEMIKAAAMSGEDGDDYEFPPIDLLEENTYSPSLSGKAQILENSRRLEETLRSFGVEARVVEVSKGPSVTRYELSPGVGVKVNKIANLSDDLALNLAANGIRIEAPVPGKSVVGVEIPNKEVQPVFLREVIEDEAFIKSPSKLAFAVGKDVAGTCIVSDVAKMPHLLIAGSTGSGKSVCVNTIIAGILYKSRPDEVKLLMVDPKVVELSVYNGIPHLLIPVVTDPKKAAGALNWAVQEMDARYNMFAETMTRDLKGYNAHIAARGEKPVPQIVIIIDELADLMMTAKGDVETAICRIAQKARAAGIHLIIATQRPSVDVITGLIKTNVPSRLAFAVASGVDSRTILDTTGAEKLMGKGDMLFSPVGVSKPVRIQGAFISDKEVERIVGFLKRDYEVEYDPTMVERITTSASKPTIETTDDDDEFLGEAVEFLSEKDKASVSMLQRRFRIGYNRAARLMEVLESRGVVGPEDGAKPRKVLLK